MFVEITRLLIVLACMLVGLAAGRELGVGNLGGIIGTLVGYVWGGILGRSLDRGFGFVEESVSSLPASTVFTAAIGAVVGGLGGVFVAGPFMLIFPYAAVVVAGCLAVWVCGAFGARLASAKAEELLGLAGLSTRPLIRSLPYEVDDGHILDTSAVMDGRLVELVRAGFLDTDLFLSRFVLEELQGFADARDGAQARRAQRGLEMLEHLRAEGRVRLRILDQEIPERTDVDAKLVELARRLEIRLLTCDVNLQRVAELQGVAVVNLRKLADDLRPEIVAGDVLTLELVRDGRESGQGVGYLDDGSMVVVNDGSHLVGAGVIDVEVSTTVPTSVGRLVFARPVEGVPAERDAGTADPATAKPDADADAAERDAVAEPSTGGYAR